jgi:SAM-dependent methyltransferase
MTDPPRTDQPAVLDIVAHNQTAWANKVAHGNVWTRPVPHEVIERARRGDHAILLTATKPVPADWLGELTGKHVLCLAAGGGQQGPVLAALGAEVTVFDNSPAQLAADTMVAEREGLPLRSVQGDMRDLSSFGDDAFDLIVHPVSNCFVDDILPTWLECYRVLRPGGALLAGFNNPVLYIFDLEAWKSMGLLQVRYRVPHSDAEDLPPNELAERLARGRALEFGHSLTSQIGGQIAAGFVITGMYEDDDGGGDILDKHLDRYIATRAVKLPAASRPATSKR